MEVNGGGIVGGMRSETRPLLSVRELTIDYHAGQRRTVPVVRGVDLDVWPGESVALVGESGSGKTTLALSLLRLLPKAGVIRSGSILFRRQSGADVDVLALGDEELRRFRWSDAAVVYQGAQNALNPLMRIGTQFVETVHAHRRMSSRATLERAALLLEMVQVEPERVLRAYPHELSGGMRQRVLIALSLLLEPQLVILDEPTTALDILTQRAIVDVLADLQRRLRFAMIFVSHDLAIAAALADRVATMYAGRIVELADVRETFYRARHPYTIGLIDAVVPVTGGLPDVASIPGSAPAFGSLPAGCTFSPRCPYSRDRCRSGEPPLRSVEGQHQAACYFAEEIRLGRTGAADG